MKITIITPTYNSVKTLSRTIDSVIAQNYEDLEYIIIDGVSTDDTKKIVQEYQNKIHIKFVSEPDNGIYDAMNKGIKMATGDIVGILNSDDLYYDSEVLKTVATAFEDPTIDAVYGDLKYFSEDVNKITRYWRAGEYNEAKLDNGWTIPHPTLFLRKSVYSSCGLFNTDFKIAADYEFIFRLFKVHEINAKYIPQTFVKMFNGGTSGSDLKQRKIGWAELKKAWTINGYKIPIFFTLRRVLFKISQIIKRK